MDIVLKYLQVYLSEVGKATTAFHMWVTFDKEARERPEVLSLLNENAMFWNASKNSWMDAFIIALGRIFDEDGESFSADMFLKIIIQNIEQFKLDNLRKRVIESTNDNAPWIDEFMADAFEPDVRHFQIMRSKLKVKRDIFNDIYKPIRNKIIAHKDLETIDSASELLAKTNFIEIKELLSYLNRVYLVLFNLIHNGTERKVEDFNINVAEDIEKDILNLLDRLVENNKMLESAFVETNPLN
ncbi:MAG: hypothetical protein OCC49_14745 [Fibrobacterales bacterium]